MQLQDPNLKIICEEILNSRVPIESIIPCGSRAKAENIALLSESSDYDIIVVMKTPLVPPYLRRLKNIENALIRKIGVKVNLNPLPIFHIKNAKGNLFLFKLKREGVVLWGKDYIKVLNPGDIKDISAEWYFSYFFSLMKKLAESFDPKSMQASSKEVAKILFGCGELLLLLKGVYETKPKNIVDKLILTMNSSNDNFIDGVGFLNSLYMALKAIENRSMEVNPLEFFLSIRDYAFDIFRLLMRHFYNVNETDLDRLIVGYLKITESKIPLKNWEYLALTLLIKREFSLKNFVSKPSITDKIRIALIWLLASIKYKTLSRKMLKKAQDSLMQPATSQCAKDNVELWYNIKETILNRWPYACTVIRVFNL